MKILKVIGSILLIFVLIVLLINVFTPSTFKLERSIEINANPSVVYNQVSNFSKFNNWSPWTEKDTALEFEVLGEDGTVGSIYTWKGNREVGKGMMRMIELIDNQRIAYQMQFANGKDTSIGYLNLESLEEGKTKVTWGFTGEQSFMFRFFNLIIDKMVGEDFEKGLNSLKAVCENPAATQVTVQSIDLLGGSFLYYKEDNIPFIEMSAFFAKAFGIVGADMQSKNITPTGSAGALYFIWDQENRLASAAAAMPTSPIIEGEKIKTEKVDEVEVEVFENHIATTYTGPYDDAANYYEALSKWAENNGKEIETPVFELYLVGPNDTEDSADWKTRIIHLVR